MQRFTEFLKELKVVVPHSHETLGIMRKDMPQVASKDNAEMMDYLKQHHVTFKKKTVKATVLKASQADFNIDKISKATDDYQKLKDAKPILVGSDNYVVDGHHRWLGAKNAGGDISILQANVKAVELIQLLKMFPKTFKKEIHEWRLK